MRFVPFTGGSDDDVDHYAPDTAEIDEELEKDLRERAIASGPVLRHVPYKREQNTAADKTFFRDVHTVRRGGPDRERNDSTPFAFEPYYDPDQETLSFRYVGHDEETRTELRDALDAAYHDADIHLEPPQFIDAEAGQSVSAARTTLRHPEALRPIDNPGMNPENFNPSPHNAITRRMTGSDRGGDAAVVTQVVFMPAISHATPKGDGNDNQKSKLNWHYGVDTAADEIEEADVSIRWAGLPEMVLDSITEGTEEIQVLKKKEPSQKEINAAKMIRNQVNQKGYHINVRVVAVADDPAEAQKRVARTIEKYRNFYNSSVGQGLKPVFDCDVVELAKKAARRSWVDRGIMGGLDEALALGAPPTMLTTPEVDYTHRKSDQGMPAGAESIDDYDETWHSELEG